MRLAKIGKRIYLGLVAGLVIFPVAVLAEYPNHGVYFGVYGGYMMKLGNWDLGNSDDVLNNGLNQPKSSLDGGVRVGFHFLSQLVGEVGGGVLPLTSTAGGKNTGLKADVDLYFHLLRGDNSPFLGLGAGEFIVLKGGDLGGDNDMQLHVSLGIRGLLSRSIALRAEVRDYMVDDYSKIGWGQNLEITGGLDFYIAGAGKKPPPDFDNDGVPDSIDKCSDKPGKPELQGCPDRDNDGIADPQDKCPDEAGDAAHDGCPVRDKDGDGVLDAQDQCPSVAGPAVLNGCPDRDGDGVADKDDQCPDQAGPKALNGCPDRDGDGIADKNDQCPDQAGTNVAKGCPDKDGDGVADKDDKCPDVTGLPEYQGCVPAAVKKFTGVIKGINFKTGSATILPNSFNLLDQAVIVLNEYKSLRIRIEGHTDNVGDPGANQKLSEERAESVKTYFMSKGIDFNRIETAGYGDTRSVQSNRTAAGRAANRRIEFSIMGQ